ncbi:MAG: ATP-binding protein [Lachnospiraceae bacterium]|nr:ATP-binding protein [Lachnospiraceae bacterium]
MTALFIGRPGTGKTMAAECIAGSLGLPLYHVNLSQILDKYIGETEKKLDKIFEYAQVSNVLLFFDEADALFGKRSEVKDARDKYANAEVSYILARVERFSGAAILATNLMENIDEAFMRRMRFVVNFPIPDKAIRAEIWRSSFPEATPTEDLDIDYIADKCELAGGHIKNIVIKSVFLAAARKRKVTMLDIMESIRDEYNKLGKNINISEFFPEYAHYVKQHSIFK